MLNVLDGSLISPLSNLTEVRLSGDWRVAFTNADDVPYDFEVLDEASTLWSVVKPTVDLSGADEYIADIEISIYVKDVTNINFGFPIRLIRTSWFVELTGFTVQGSLFQFFGDVFPAQIQPERLALLKYDQETKVFSFPAKHPDLVIPEGTTEFWIETVLTLGGLSPADGTIAREYFNTAWGPSFTRPLTDGNQTKPTKVHRHLHAFIAGDPN